MIYDGLYWPGLDFVVPGVWVWLLCMGCVIRVRMSAMRYRYAKRFGYRRSDIKGNLNNSISRRTPFIFGATSTGPRLHAYDHSRRRLLWHTSCLAKGPRGLIRSELAPNLLTSTSVALWDLSSSSYVVQIIRRRAIYSFEHRPTLPVDGHLSRYLSAAASSYTPSFETCHLDVFNSSRLDWRRAWLVRLSKTQIKPVCVSYIGFVAGFTIASILPQSV